MGTGVEDFDRDQPSYPAGVPNPDKFDFIPIGVLGGRLMAEADEAIREIAERLRRPVRTRDRQKTEIVLSDKTVGALPAS